jgi:class 3 adenylate cyclase/predicted ATPase
MVTRRGGDRIKVTGLDIAKWLNGLGLQQYEQAFRDNAIDAAILPDLTAEDLKELGVNLVGHRRKMLAAIAALRGERSPRRRAADKVAPAAERRQITVMFCDVVDSTALSSRLDPEDLHEVLGGYQECVAETIRRYDGFVARYMGDGVLAYFGYPQAHEDDAERAVRAGLAQIEAVRDLQTRERLEIRIGIGTGLVVVGGLAGIGEVQEWAISGETPNLAARLQALAEPNTVVIDPRTRRLVGNLFEYRDLGAVPLRGFVEPVHSYEVLRPSAVESRFEALHPDRLTPLVDREDEIELLRRRWAQAKAGSGRVVLVSAEAGIGKSRLVEAFRDGFEGERYTRLRYFCSPHHQDSALFPFIGQLERAAGFTRDDAHSVRFGKLEALLAPNAPSERDVPLLAELLSLPLDNRYPALDFTPQERKEKTFEALLRQFAALAKRQPILMIFEDLHWADPTSRELLDLTVEYVARMPVLLVVTFRPEFEAPWAGQPHVETLSLARLGPEESGELVHAIIGSTAALPREIVDQIIERTDGVPLFLEELTKAVVETAMSGADAGKAAVLSVAAVSPAVPATLQASLMARLDLLGSTAKEVLQTGAVIGRDFSYEVLAAIGQWTDWELRGALSRLVAAGLVFQREMPPRASYLFKHALLQDIAYSMLLLGLRRSLHGRIARVLEEQFSDAMQARPETLAHHFTEAGLFEKAVGYWCLAGRQSAARSGFVEAIVQLRTGLRLIADLPDTLERKQQELELQIALAGALTVVKGYAHPEVAEASARARNLIPETGQPGTITHFSVLRGLWAADFVAGKPKAALDHAEEFLSLAQSQPGFRVLATGHWLVGRVLITIGDYAAAATHLERAVASYRAGEHRPLDPFDPRFGAEIGVTAMAGWALALWHRGYPDRAHEAANEALQRARRLRHPHTLAYGLLIVGLVALCARKTAEAEELGNELVALSNEHRFAFFSGMGQIFQGWALAQRGEGRAAVQRIREGFAAAEATGWRSHEPGLFGLLAEALAATGAIGDGLTVLSEALATAEETGAIGADAELHRLRGELRRRLPSPDSTDVEGCFRTALTVAREQGTHGYELRAAVSLARLLSVQGRRAEVREALAPGYSRFTEGFDTPDLQEAKALLEAVDA